MLNYRKFALGKLAQIGPRYLPFADVASENVPLSRLLRLSLFQVTVGMALVLLVGTLNRVMIVELDVSAALVGIMISLPLLFAPFRTLIGFKSDTFGSAFGWRRVPFIFKGTMLQFGGFAIMPFALLVLSGYGEAVDAPRWIGLAAAGLAFLLVGAGVHMVQTVGLALATDLVPEEDQPNVVGLMYVMLLVGMIVSAFIFGALLENYTPGRLIQCIQGAAVITIVLNAVAVWKQEGRNWDRAQAHIRGDAKPEFSDSWREFIAGQGAMRLLVVIAFGTLGFGMADVLLEPYGGQVLGMSVAQTTKLTAVLASGSLIGFALASRVLSKGASPVNMSFYGAAVGLPAFAAIIASAQLNAPMVFVLATLAAGFGAGLFGHGTLTATMRSAPKEQIGLSLGAWGAVQATAAGVGVAAGGIIRDVMVSLPSAATAPPQTAYIPVFALELVFLAAALIAIYPLMKKLTGTRRTKTYLPVEET
ncbi:PucC family protein [uncultured Litoreibacter sp.]|uniref:PucC family protein n=1 Tax=uncultured Litoreibacter sp. TaxID=1392394 RepID=UPI002624B455|nr:PucC family protein [uncultured Litoreibacter sp.]